MSTDMQLRLVISADGSASVQVVNQTSAALEGMASTQGRVNTSTKGAADGAAAYVSELRKQLTGLQASAQAFREIEAMSRGATAQQTADIRALGQQIDSLNAHAQAFGGVASGVAGTLAGWLAPVAVLAALREMVSTITDARLQVEKLNSTQLFSNAGDVQAAGRDIEFVKQRANALGLEFVTVANSWGKFNAAARGTVMAGQGARDVFDSILKASTVLRLSSQETEGALLAVQQMMSKGNVQAEELRGQLGERLPGAFAIAARAMGVTERELNKLLETGQVLASDFLPKFGAQLTKELGDSVQSAANGTQASLNRLSNAYTEFKQQIAQVGEGAPGISLLANLFDGLANKIAMARADGAGFLVVLARLAALSANGGLGVDLKYGGAAGQKDALGRELGQQISEMSARQAASENEVTKQRYQVAIDARKAMLVKMYEIDVALATTEKDSLQRRAENNGVYSGLVDQQKSSNDRYLKELAQAGDKKAKLALANKEIDDKFNKDLAAGTRTLAEVNLLRAAEYKKIYGGDNKQAAEAVYREFIATEERLQAAIEKSLKDESEALKRAHDLGEISELDYVKRIGEIRIIAQAEHEESVRRELLAAQNAVKAGVAAKKQDVAKYLAEEKEFGNQRLKIEGETDAATLAAKNRFFADMIAAQMRHNERLAALAQGRRDGAVARAEELEQMQFELSLLGKDEQNKARLQALRTVELNTRKELTAAQKDYNKALEDAIRDGASPEKIKAITESYLETKASIEGSAAAQRELTIAVVDGKAAYDRLSAAVDSFIEASMHGFKGIKDWLKTEFFAWLKTQVLKPLIMQIVANVTGGVGGGGVGGIANSLLGANSGIGSLLGSVASSLIGAGDGIGAAAGVFESVMAGTGSFLEAGGAAIAALGEAGGMLGAAAGVLAAIPVIGWIALAVAAAYAIFGGDEKGIKIDNNLTHVGNPSSHFTDDKLSKFDVSGDLDAKVFAVLTGRVQAYDKVLVDGLLTDDQTAAIRDKLGHLINPDWIGFDDAESAKKAIEGASKEFLQARYGAVFDELDAGIAAKVRQFAGTSEELLVYIGDVIGVFMTLKTNAAAFAAVIGETVTGSDLAKLSKEGETLAQTLTRVVSVFQETNAIASILGKGADAFGAVGLASLDARERVVALAGGLQSLTTDMNFYLEKFFTEDERLAMAKKNAQATLDAGFKALGIAIPDSKDSFRALVSGIDLTTKAGQDLFVALMKLAPAFDTVNGSATGGPTFTITRATPGSAGSATVDYTRPTPTDAYLAHFFTASENAARLLAASGKAVDEAFMQMGVAVPKTRAEFRALVESLDLNTNRGQWMYKMLMSVAEAFDAVSTAASPDAIINRETPRSAGSAVVSNTALTPTDAYLAHFFTASENAARLLVASGKSVDEAFMQMGVAVPKTRAEFRALVEGLDLNTNRGQWMYKMLMGVAEAFDAVATAAEAANGPIFSIVRETPRSAGSAVVQHTELAAKTDAYLSFFSDAERAAMAAADAQAVLTNAFAQYGAAVPKSKAEYIAMMAAIDTSTEAGIRFYNMMMANAGVFLTATGNAKPTEATDAYLKGFFTEAQQAAYHYAQAQRQVNDAFAAAGLAVPKTRAEFVDLVNSFDQTTDYGKKMVAMLMGIVPAFIDITTAAADAVTSIRYAVGDLMSIGADKANAAWSPISAIIDAGTQSLSVKLMAKLDQANALAEHFDQISRTFGEGDDAHRIAYETARDQMLQIRAGLAGNIALLATLTAQYGADFAEQMYDLEIWHQQQIAAAAGNATLLLLIEQTYADKRNAILTGSVASGLSSLKKTIQAWLDNLLLNTQLTTLNPTQRLDESRRQYEAALASGDGSRITAAADAYLREARSFYASSEAYTAIFAQVLAQLKAIAAGQVYVPPPLIGPPPLPRASAASSAVAQSTAAAQAAAASAAQANNTMLDILAKIKFGIDEASDAHIAADAANTDRLIAATAPTGLKRVAV